MANFGKLVLTKDGMKLQARAEGGTPLKAKRMAMGSGRYDGNIQNLTALVTEEVSIDVNNAKLYNDNSFLFEGYFENKDLNKGFEWREIGLFMENPDDPLKEILFCYSNSGESSDYIPANEDERYDKYLNIQVSFSNASSVVIEVPQSPLVIGRDEFEQHKNSNMHFHVCESGGNSEILNVTISSDIKLTSGQTLLIKLNADIQNGTKLSVNGSGALPIKTGDGKDITEGMKTGQYILVSYTGTHWSLIGNSPSVEQVTRNKESFIATEGQTVFHLTKGKYTLNNNCVDLYINGVAQPDESFVETNETTITLAAGVEENDLVMFDYMLVSQVVNAETPNGAQMKVDALEKKLTNIINKLKEDLTNGTIKVKSASHADTSNYG